MVYNVKKTTPTTTTPVLERVVLEQFPLHVGLFVELCMRACTALQKHHVRRAHIFRGEEPAI